MFCLKSSVESLSKFSIVSTVELFSSLLAFISFKSDTVSFTQLTYKLFVSFSKSVSFIKSLRLNNLFRTANNSEQIISRSLKTSAMTSKDDASI